MRTICLRRRYSRGRRVRGTSAGAELLTGCVLVGGGVGSTREGKIACYECTECVYSAVY